MQAKGGSERRQAKEEREAIQESLGTDKDLIGRRIRRQDWESGKGRDELGELDWVDWRDMAVNASVLIRMSSRSFLWNLYPIIHGISSVKFHQLGKTAVYASERLIHHNQF
jgi:hypothetical protein